MAEHDNSLESDSDRGGDKRDYPGTLQSFEAFQIRF